jgi:hypothetical protein
MNEATNMTSDWSRARQGLVGGSEVACLIGEGDGFVTEYELYHRKRGTAPEFVVTEQMKLGTIFEPAIIAATEVLLGWESLGWAEIEPSILTLAPGVTYTLTERGPLLRHESGLGGTPDGLTVIDGVIYLLETKLATSWALRDWPGEGEELPTGYLCQVWTYLGLLGLAKARVAVFSDGRLLTFEVEAHPAMFAHLCDLARKFWVRVAANDEPEPDPIRDTDTVSRRFRSVSHEGTVDRSTDAAFVSLVAEYHAARGARLVAEKVEESRKTMLLHRIGDAARVIAGPLTVSVAADGRVSTKETRR